MDQTPILPPSRPLAGDVRHSQIQHFQAVVCWEMTYYNRQRIYTANPGGLPSAMYRQAARGLAA